MCRTPFALGNAMAGVCAVTCAYLVFYLHMIRRFPIDNKALGREAPMVIPIATASSLLSGLLYAVAFWPVWGLLTLPIQFALLLALLSVLSFLG